ncbi:MAG: ribose 5-phosphate isomerase B [Omnitrophica bacterium RIFCSPLOWO2_12_FULL_50_11]|nr:MAG: ribose 5-phosphate isomerase B [Omnitrophica bacterium RIFCSPLOWO2_12_FULL_50_11]
MRLSFAIASDHRGVQLKRVISEFLKSKGYRVEDLGTGSEESVDYPDYALKAAEAVVQGKTDYAVVICHSGIGVSVSANKVKGIRAALCHSVGQAEYAKKHANANVLALPSGFVEPEVAKEIVSTWIKTDFEGGRHERRIGKITDYEKRNQSL